MSHIIVSGSMIIGTALSIVDLPGGDVQADGVVFPTSVPGWAVVDTGHALPSDFSIQSYAWSGGVLVRLPDNAEMVAAALGGKLIELNAFTAQQQGVNVTIAAVGGFPTSFAPGWLGLINGAYLAAKADDAFTTEWQDEAGGIHSLTSAQVIAVWQAGTAYTNACFANQSTHAAKIRAMASVAQITRYDFTTGWPATDL